MARVAVDRQSQRSVPATGGTPAKPKCAERARIWPGGTSGRAIAAPRRSPGRSPARPPGRGSRGAGAPASCRAGGSRASRCAPGRPAVAPRAVRSTAIWSRVSSAGGDRRSRCGRDSSSEASEDRRDRRAPPISTGPAEPGIGDQRVAVGDERQDQDGDRHRRLRQAAPPRRKPASSRRRRRKPNRRHHSDLRRQTMSAIARREGRPLGLGRGSRGCDRAAAPRRAR